MNSSTVVAKKMRDMKISDTELFASRAYGDYLRNLLSYACRRIRRKTPPVIVLNNERLPQVAWTDDRSININVGHPMVSLLSSNKRTKKARIINGLLTHEFGHCRFTDFAAIHAAQQRMTMGLGWYPALPEELEDDIQKNKDDFELFLKEHQNRIHQILDCWHNVENIIEDGYIEECLYHVMNGILLDGLNYLRYKQSTTSSTLASLLVDLREEKIDMYDAVTSLLLTYVKYGKLNCDWDNPDEVHSEPMMWIRSCRAYMDNAIYGSNTQTRLRNIHLTFLALWPVIRKRIESVPEGASGCGKASEIATGSMTSSSPSSSTKEKPDGVSKSEDTGKSGSSKSRSETVKRIGKTFAGKDEDETEAGKLAKPEEGDESPTEGEEPEDKPGSGKGDADEEEPVATKEPESESGDEGEDEKETEPDSEGDGSGKDDDGEDEEDAEAAGASGDTGGSEGESGSDDGDSDKEAPKSDESETVYSKAPTFGGHESEHSTIDVRPDPEAEGEVIEPDDEGYTTEVDAEESYDAAEAVKAMRRIEASLRETAAVDAANDDLMESIRADEQSIDYGAAHSGLHIILERIKTVSPSTRALYAVTMKPIEDLADTMAKKVLPIIKKKDQENNMPMNGFFTGARFDASRLVFNDWRNFRQNVAPQPDTRLAVSVLVDESGSMNLCDRAEMARAAAMALYLFCDKCDIKCAVIGHTAAAGEDDKNDVMFKIYSDYDTPDRDDKYRLMDIQGKKNNRDGAAILFAGERLLKRSEPTKLLFIISDGAPCANGYDGAAAEDDMAQIVGELRRKGVIVFAAAIGNDKANIHRIYGEGFIDITNLNTLPDQLLSMVKRYIR